MNRKLSLVAAALACLSASPAPAADLRQLVHEQPERSRIGGYVGVTISLARTAGREHAPSLRLGMGARHLSGATAAAPIGAPRSSVELDLSASGKPNLYLGGRRLSAAEGGGWGTGETLLVIAGVVGAVFLATQLGGSDDDDDEQCMIEPELCD
jgi:hypothetical protein